MLKIVFDALRAGRATQPLPEPGQGYGGAEIGRFELADGSPEAVAAAVEVCPSGAIATAREGEPGVLLDEGRCVFCGLCAEGEKPAFRNVQHEPAVSRSRAGLLRRFPLEAPVAPPIGPDFSEEDRGRLASDQQKLSALIRKRLRGSLQVRHLDAGGCNGCEWELNQLQGPTFDLQRFGVDFVASPRHADMLLVTGVVTRNLELAMVRTLDAMPRPRLVVAVGACAISGGIFGTSYASLGGVDRVLGVDAYVAGCAPRPWAILRGMIAALS
jgi:Ni,Fe-hydrogenase III small subunit/ferredoxin